MALWSNKGDTNPPDLNGPRTSFGTVGGEHVVPKGLGGRLHNGIFSPFEASVSYTGNWNLDEAGSADESDLLARDAHTTTSGSTITLTFNGTSIAVFGQNGPSGGRAQTYIDGVQTLGRSLTYTVVSATYYSAGGLNAVSTSVVCGDTSSLSTSGVIQIDAEEIAYSGVAGSTLTGCTRGYNGTTAASHAVGTTIYALVNQVEFYSPYYQDRVVVWSVNNLSPGIHTVTLRLATTSNTSSAGNTMRINGFNVGGLIGASSVYTYIDYATFTGIATNANGFSTVDQGLVLAGTDRQIIGILGGWCTNGSQNIATPVWNPTTNNLRFQFSAADASKTGLSVIVTLMMLGPTIA